MALPARIAMQHRIRCTAAYRQLIRLYPLPVYCTSREIPPYISEEVSSSTAVPVPLCLRPAEVVQLLSDLLSWRQRVIDSISCLKDAFETADGGPTSAALQREVTWVLDDVVEGFLEHQQQQWVPITWQQLDSEIQTAPRRGRDCTQWQVRLRAPVQQLEQLWKLRLQDRVPFEYLIHTAHWRDLVLSVGPGTLVPRPETELLIDLAAAAITANPALAAPWADLGTGSGAVAIALAKLLQQQQQRFTPNTSAVDHQPPNPQHKGVSRVLAVDLSPTAVAYATANAARCGVQDRIEVLQGSWFEPLQEYKRQLGGILSNPPYIPRVQMEGLQAEVGRHEPWGALDGGSEAGIDSLQVICEGAAEMLIPGGFLALETPLSAVKPGELPSVLRTSSDFSNKLVTPAGTTNLAASAAKEDAGKQAAARGHLVSTDVAAAAVLPRLESGSHHPGLPTRAPKPASPPRPNRGSLTPERVRGSKAQDSSRSSNDPPGAAGSPGSAGHLQATAASGAAASWRASSGGAGRQSPEVPAVGSVAMSALPASFYRKLTAEAESSSSNRSTPSPHIDAAATGSPQAADDTKLLRPVDPSKPGYYWKPVQGESAAAAVREAMGPAANADNVLSFQVLQEVAGQDPLSAPIAHVRQRKSMLMRLPLGTEHFLEAVPAAVQDKAGHACLLVLPSDKPSNRKEAMAVEALLAELLKDPETAVLKACQWRAAALAEMCNESLGVVAEALKQKGPPGSWQFAELNNNLTGQMLGSSMVEALDRLITENTDSAERMAGLLNPREATAQVGAAAVAAVAAAAATTAPASLRSPSAVLLARGAAAAAVHDLAETSAVAQQHQEQLQRGLQQQVAASMNRHQQQMSQVHQLDSEQQQQSPKTPGTLRSSRLASAVDRDAGSSPQQSGPQSPSRQSATPRRSVLQHSAASPAVSTNSQAAADSNGTAVEQTRVGVSTTYRSLQVVTDAQSLSRQGSGVGKLPQQQNSSSSGQSDHPQQQQPEHQVASGLLTPGTAKSRLSTATHHLSSSGGDSLASSNGSKVRSSSKSPRRSRPGTPATSAADAQHSPVQSPGQKGPSAEHDVAVGAAANGPEGAEQLVEGDGQVVLVHQKGLDLSRLYGLALAASVCMADLVRQVEVACVERGRALIYAWNCSVGAAEEAMVELRGQNKKLLVLNSGLTQDLNNIDKELKGLDFVRREAIRFRKELEDVQAQLSTATADNTRLKGRLEVADAQMEVVDSFCRKRLARMRWRNAFATLGTWSRQSVIQSGGSKEDANQLLAKVVMLEKLANAVNAVEHRKMAYGRNQVKEKFEYNRPQMSDMVQVMTLGPQVVAPGRVHDGYNIDSTVQMLAALTPEARTMVIATMPPVQRWKVLEAMRDEERAAMVIAMSAGLRKEAAEAVDARLWERTMEVIRSHSGYASRYLTSMDIDDAAIEFQSWDIYQKADTLSALDTYTAAALLTRTKQKERKQLLGMLEPYLAANIHSFIIFVYNSKL